ncbi:hypothetical protein EYF80_051350 [Liparis tanakae]|uniref:Uncharacterized protein n=1 Tax=Liparis tanakae TaxID=230148 RepID=A0A4Z2FDM2_9TELE|nr:hypothetical protein EYF80_051350 [Liparis tanakae]
MISLNASMAVRLLCSSWRGTDTHLEPPPSCSPAASRSTPTCRGEDGVHMQVLRKTPEEMNTSSRVSRLPLYRARDSLRKNRTSSATEPKAGGSENPKRPPRWRIFTRRVEPPLLGAPGVLQVSLSDCLEYQNAGRGRGTPPGTSPPPPLSLARQPTAVEMPRRPGAAAAASGRPPRVRRPAPSACLKMH